MPFSWSRGYVGGRKGKREFLLALNHDRSRRQRIPGLHAGAQTSKSPRDGISSGSRRIRRCGDALRHQNELGPEDAKRPVENGVLADCEGANMPVTHEAAELLRSRDVLHAPGKASNAGGVAVSGLEQSQNAMRLSWDREEVDRRLQKIMSYIHARCIADGSGGNSRVD
ncbi:MAG: hypothetical protein ABL994_05685 [Verrucomicrobiales bacterium]